MTTRPVIRLTDLRVTPSARRAVAKVLSGGWLSTGPLCSRLEETLARHWSVPHVVAVGSASIGLLLALKASGVRAGDEVITTPLTFVASLEAILQCGALPVLADIGADLLISPNEIERKVTRKTAAVLTVDLAGHPCDYQSIKRLTGKQLTVIADASHAAASLYRDRPVACWVDAAVCSLHATKNLTAGEGGAVASKRKQLAAQVRLLSRHGMTSNAWTRRTGNNPLYDVIAAGYKGNLSDLHAAVALGQFARLPREQLRREQLARRYETHLSAFPDLFILPQVASTCRHAWHLYIAQLPALRNESERNRLIQQLRSRQIETGVHYRPLHQLAAYRSALRSERLPMTDAIAPKLLSLPMHPHLKNADVDRVCEELIAALRPVTRARRS